MTWWEERAGRLQQEVRSDERRDAAFYEKEEVARATVHGREDLILIVSYLTSANEQLASSNKQLATIRWLLMAVVVAVAAIALKLLF